MRKAFISLYWLALCGFNVSNSDTAAAQSSKSSSVSRCCELTNVDLLANENEFVSLDHARKVYHGGVLEHWFGPMLTRLQNLEYLDERAEALRYRNAELEVENATLQYQVQLGCEENARATRLKEEGTAEGGSESSRTIASLETSDPGLLSKPPKAVFLAAIKAFEEEDYETAAKAFVSLADNSENDAFQTAKVFYLTGVSLYQLENYKQARHYFELSKKHALKSDGDNGIQFAPRAQVWIALCFSKLGDEAARKAAIHELIQKYPKSKEAQRVNRG